MNKVLIITYYWPPSGGAGVQRWLKFSKYLPEFGWEPIILTVDPEYAAYPVIDLSLNEELPDSIKIYTTPATDYFSIYKKDKSKIPSAGFANNTDNTVKGKLLRFIRGNFFLPDPRKGWNKYAFKKACELIETGGIKHIITTSPPHSTQLIGLKIKKKYRDLNWIADLRDPWTDIYYYRQFYPTIISKWIDASYEKSVLANADKIITVGESLKSTFALKVRGIENKIHVITNGYDESDFKGFEPCDPSTFTITYVGTLSDIYPVETLVTALKGIKNEGIDFSLRFVGAVSGKARDIILSDIPCDSVEFLPYVKHSKAIDYLTRSTILILIIPSHPSNKGILTGKIFEYIASGKPVLCLGPPDGDAADIINKCKAGLTVDYNDNEKITAFLKNYRQYSGSFDKQAVREYSRHSMTQKMVSLLNNEKD
jgi:glycosyltransferase involved in cell wall biosynthesis